MSLYTAVAGLSSLEIAPAPPPNPPQLVKYPDGCAARTAFGSNRSAAERG